MDQILGQILAFGFNWSPAGWVQCNGQLLSIQQYTALYTLLSTTFGGDGRTTFGVPDLQGRTIVGLGQGYNGATPFTNVTWGQKGGVEGLALSSANLPAHIHPITNGNGTSTTVKVTTSLQSVNNANETNDSGNGGNYLGTTDSNMPNIYREAQAGDNSVNGMVSTISGNTGYNTTQAPTPISLRNPYLGLMYCIATEGIYPTRP